MKIDINIIRMPLKGILSLDILIIQTATSNNSNIVGCTDK